MKAFVFKKYGRPDVLKLTDVPKPAPMENEVLIKIHATTVTAGDWRMRKADPFVIRIYNGIFKPKKVNILGFEISGIIEEIGKKVDKFSIGDKVFASCGMKFGGYSEYKCLSQIGPIAIIPKNLNFVEAAAVPVGACTAVRFLRKAEIKKENKILIYGASGSVGTYSVQLAKYYGANVTGICSTTNIDMVKSLGADKVIDYTKKNLSNIDEKYDVVFDAVGKASKSKCKKLLKPGGIYFSVMDSSKSKVGDLEFVKKIIEKEKLKPVIDKIYKFDEIPIAHKYVEKFHKKGNVVIKIIDS